MKVKELIADLQTMDPEADVTVNTFAGCHGLDDSFQISGTDFWPANEKYKTPASAFIEVGTGCFCDGHRGSKLKKLNLGPQNIDQRTLGIQEAIDEVYKLWKWYQEQLLIVEKPKDYEDAIIAGRYVQAKKSLENIIISLNKKIAG